MRWGSFAAGDLIEGGWINAAAELAVLTEKAAATERVIALLPGEQVACRALPSAPRGAAKLRAAAGYLMEDELGEPVAALTIAVATNRPQPIAFAVKTEILNAWREAFSAAAIDCDSLSADYLALPTAADQAMVIAERDRVIAAVGGIGASVERALFSAVAERLFPNPDMRVSLVGDSSLTRLFPQADTVDWIGDVDDGRILSIFADAVRSAPPPNFLQTSMISRKAVVAAIAPWRRAAMIAATLAGVLLAGAVVDGVRATREANRWTAAAAELHQKFFPDSPTADPAAFARRRLNQGGGAQSFLWLSSRFADALESNEGVQIDRIRFNAARGEFIVSIQSDSDAGIESLKSTLAASGVIAQDSGGYHSDGGVWKGELTARAQ